MPGIPGAMTEDHKAALAIGRAQGRAVRLYLEALERNKPKRGRKPKPENLEVQLADVNERLEHADPLQRLQLLQERTDIQERIASLDYVDVITELESDFINIAAAYSAAKGIEYDTWREIGVPASVLATAGIRRVG